MNRYSLLFRRINGVYATFKCNLHVTAVDLKGHSKWQNIKHIKAANDHLKSLNNARYLRQIRIAIRDGGGSSDPVINTALSKAIEEAISHQVPKSSIDNALKRIKEGPDLSKYHRHIFEMKMFGKVYVLIAIYTDNLQRVRCEIGPALKKHRTEESKTRHLFTERGVFHAIAPPANAGDQFEDLCTDDAIDSGAEDVEIYDAVERQVTFYCEPRDFAKVGQKLRQKEYRIEHSECEFTPNVPSVTLNSDEEKSYNIFKDKIRAAEGFDEIYDNVEEHEE